MRNQDYFCIPSTKRMVAFIAGSRVVFISTVVFAKIFIMSHDALFLFQIQADAMNCTIGVARCFDEQDGGCGRRRDI